MSPTLTHVGLGLLCFLSAADVLLLAIVSAHIVLLDRLEERVSDLERGRMQ